jgi:hypothetical protein
LKEVKMDIFVARKARLGFGTVSVLTRTRPQELQEAASQIIVELEEMVAKEEELVIATALRLNLEELKRLMALEPTEENLVLVRVVCDNVMQSFHAIG